MTLGNEGKCPAFSNSCCNSNYPSSDWQAYFRHMEMQPSHLAMNLTAANCSTQWVLQGQLYQDATSVYVPMGNWASHDRRFLRVPLLYSAFSTPIGLFIKSNKHFKNAAQVLIWVLLPLGRTGGCFEPEEAQRDLCDQAGMWRMKAPSSGLPTSEV